MSIINSLIIAESDDFVEQEILYDGMFSSSSIVTQSDTQIKFVKKKIADLNPLITSEQLISFCTKLTKLQYHFYLPFSYISLDNQPALYTTYIPNQSLQDVINQQMKEVFNEIDSTQEYLIIYGISVYLEELHNSQKVHGRIKLTNILLDQNFSPLISDSFLYEITNRHLNSEVPNKTLDYIISLSPEALKDQPLTIYSDIYSFAIVILQVLRRKINIYSNISNDPVEIEKYILNDGKPLISEQYILNDEKQSNFYKILEKCFSSKQDERPSASQLKAALEQILISKKYSKRFEQFKNSIEHSKIDANKEIIELKERAEKGNLDDIYSYGYILLTGEKCTKNELEGMNYIRYAAKKGFSPAQSTYNIFRKDVSNPASSPLIEEEPKNKMQVFLHLKDDPFFIEKDAKIEEIIEKVKHNYNETQKNNINKTKIQQFDFIPTEKALERLMKLLYYIESNVPVILEGPTGTSKTLSVEIISNYTKRKMIRFNLSSETKIADFLGKYINDSNSWAGIQTVPGPFIDAYEKGYTLLLDEMNLASPDCLQFIEDALDSGVISVEVSNMPLREIKMHKDFRLIATQNPNKDFYVHKRKDFTKKFLSRFQVINFPEFEDDELLEIAIELAKKNNFNDIDLIKDLVKFHIDCKSLTENDNDIRCYTVREIAATVKALSKKENIYDTIMTIYGARYQKEKKNEIEKMLRKYQNFKDCKPSDNFCYPRGFPECFHNDSLSNVMRSVKFSFDNHRPVILIGSEGSGLTQVAYWIAEKHNLYGRFSKIEAKFLFMCTEETKNSDLIGQYKPSNHLNSSDISNIEPIEWANGLLPNVVENGFCIVLDNIDQAPTTVSERINGLLDKKFDDKDKENYVFEIPENPKKPKIPINQDFRLICTCKKDNLNQMSPAFINRFDVIFLEDQTTKDETQFKLLISILMKQTYLINELYQPNQNEYSNMNQSSENTDTDSDSDSDSNDFCFKKNMKEDKKEEKEENKIDQNLINILYDKIKDLKITMFKLSQLCRAVLKYYYYFPKEIEKETIINFSIDQY